MATGGGGDLSRQPLWYKDAIIYELHVRAFADGSGDGVGDFRGLAGRLPYLRDLGVSAVWLLPFYPSPLKDDGYDIADYTSVHPDYGTLSDFKLFLKEAHRLGLRVITELVLNHTSDQHPWFQRARREPPGSVLRNYYVWSDTPERYADARIIFKDFESSNWTWDPVAKAYFWHRFYHHQPDLNYDNPEVRRAMERVVDFWFDLGVDGLRLDAVPYLHEREDTNCENLPESHAVIRDLRAHVDRKYRDRILLAEANQWPEDATRYFGDGDECHMAFHFPLMPRMFMALRMEDRYPIVDILEQTPEIPNACQWAIFLRNHDELTLEMVTDEERDYMYKVYASDPRARINLGIRRRLAPLLGGDRRRVELMSGLLLSLPGTPVLYYGDEIMMGDNIYLGDRNGVRTPMQWSPDRNAGFSLANAQRLYLPVIIDPAYHYESVNVEAQENNPHSILWWTRRLLALRKRTKAFSQGSLRFLHPDNRKVLAFLREREDERILVVANLSRFAQFVELDLSDLAGFVPSEMFGDEKFPEIGNRPYFLTLGPHAFFWFSLAPALARETIEGVFAEVGAGVLESPDGWKGLFGDGRSTSLHGSLAEYIARQRWFGGKARSIRGATVRDEIEVPLKDGSARVLLVELSYSTGEPDLYLVPIAYAEGARAAQIEYDHPREIVARLLSRDGSGLVYGGLLEPEVAARFLDLIRGRKKWKGRAGDLHGLSLRGLPDPRSALEASVQPHPIRAEQTNSSIQYGEKLILKLFRRVEEGINPELEIGRFLTERTDFTGMPALAGAVEYRSAEANVLTLGVLHAFVENGGDAWKFTQDQLREFFERMSAARADIADSPPSWSPLDLTEIETPPQAMEWIGGYLEFARRLGERSAQLHLALSSVSDDPSFSPEPSTPFFQRSMYQSLRNLGGETLQILKGRLDSLADPTRSMAMSVLASWSAIERRFRRMMEARSTAMRTRIHGDYHLGQVLYTGRDFVIIDFEGEPGRTLTGRRLKQSPLKDVAGMLRSFHYAAQASLREHLRTGWDQADEALRLNRWADLWVAWISAAFLGGYLSQARGSVFVPEDRSELDLLLNTFLLEKAIYELKYELNNRPDWVDLPLRGILSGLDRNP